MKTQEWKARDGQKVTLVNASLEIRDGKSRTEEKETVHCYRRHALIYLQAAYVCEYCLYGATENAGVENAIRSRSMRRQSPSHQPCYVIFVVALKQLCSPQPRISTHCRQPHICLTVVNFIRSQLHVNIQDTDIDIAHQLPIRRQHSTENGSPKTASSHTASSH